MWHGRHHASHRDIAPFQRRIQSLGLKSTGAQAGGSKGQGQQREPRQPPVCSAFDSKKQRRDADYQHNQSINRGWQQAALLQLQGGARQKRKKRQKNAGLPGDALMMALLCVPAWLHVQRAWVIFRRHAPFGRRTC